MDINSPKRVLILIIKKRVMKPGEFVRKWTSQELLFLQQNNDVLTYKEIGAELGRTRNAVQSKAMEIGIGKTNGFISDRSAVSQFKPGHVPVRRSRVYTNAWSEEDYQFVRDNYEKMTCAEIAEHLGRTPGAIKTAAHKVLKICRSKEAKRIICKRPNKGHYIKKNLPVNTLHDGAIKVRKSNGRVAKWIRLSLGHWVQLHRHNWRLAGNEIPKGQVLQFIDSNPLNCEASNLKLVKQGPHSRGEHHIEKKRIAALIIEERAKEREEKKKIIEHANDLKLQVRKSQKEAIEVAKILRRARKLQKNISILEARQEADIQRQLRVEQIEQAKAARKVTLEARILKKQNKSNSKLHTIAERKLIKNSDAIKKKEDRAVLQMEAKAERLRIRNMEAAMKAELTRRNKIKSSEEVKNRRANKERFRIEQERMEKSKLPDRVIDTSKLIPLRLDAKTVIYIKPGVDPDKVKEKFMHRNDHRGYIHDSTKISNYEK